MARTRSKRKSLAMFRRILVPVDLTVRGKRALDVALTIAASGSTDVTLLHVIETVPGLGFKELAPFYRKLARKATARMAAMARRAAGTDVAQRIAYGARVEEIVRFAAATDTDLIVLASHRLRSADRRPDWGTISYQVGLLARCAVLLVK